MLVDDPPEAATLSVGLCFLENLHFLVDAMSSDAHQIDSNKIIYS